MFHRPESAALLFEVKQPCDRRAGIPLDALFHKATT
jgi:hypothetical protein